MYVFFMNKSEVTIFDLIKKKLRNQTLISLPVDNVTTKTVFHQTLLLKLKVLSSFLAVITLRSNRGKKNCFS